MEIWKPCPYLFYEVSDKGQVRSRYSGDWKILTPILHKAGHLYVNLYTGKKKFDHVGVHVLVCQVFHGPKPEGKELVAHRNGDPADNRAENVYWATYKENLEDARRHGTLKCRAKHPNTNLTEEQVAYIKKVYKPRSRKFGSFALGRELGVHRTTIENIVRGTTWK